jgi:hypothetical protein
LLAALGTARQARRELARRRFAIRNRLKLELWLLTAVIAVSAVLVETPLPRSAAHAMSVSLSFPVRDVSVHVDAAAVDARHWTVRVSGNGSYGEAVPLDGADVAVRETRRNVGPFVVPMTREASGSFSGSVTLPFDGAWSAFVSARRGVFDEDHRTFPLVENTP